MGERHLNPDAVRVIRESLGLRRVDLARKSGISAGHITRIETSQRQPSVSMMLKIAVALDVPMAAITYISGGAAEQTPTQTDPTVEAEPERVLAAADVA